MTLKADVVQAIHEYADILRMDAKRCFGIENDAMQLQDDRVQRTLAFYRERFEERRRDFAIMIRKCEIMEKRFLEGRLDWMDIFRDMKRFDKAFRKRVKALDEIVYSLMLHRAA